MGNSDPPLPTPPQGSRSVAASSESAAVARSGHSAETIAGLASGASPEQTSNRDRSPAITLDDARDSRLMQAWCNGDASAFDALYERHRSALYRYLYNSTRSESHSNEIFQEVWLTVIRSRVQYKTDAPFRAWLYRIARHRVIDLYRRRSSSTHERYDEDVLSASSESEPELGPEELASLAEREGALHAALQQLPPLQRDAIVLKHIAGMNLDEIAALANENPETIKSRLRYARGRLRQILRTPT